MTDRSAAPGRATTDYFSRHPHRVAEALRRQELTFAQYGVLSFLIAAIDHGRRNRTYTTTLSDLKTAVGYPFTVELLRRDLHKLKKLGWIDFPDVVKGQRRPWTIKLRTAEIDGHLQRQPSSLLEVEPDLQQQIASSLEATSNEASPNIGANTDEEQLSSRLQPPTSQGPIEEKNTLEEQPGCDAPGWRRR